MIEPTPCIRETLVCWVGRWAQLLQLVAIMGLEPPTFGGNIKELAGMFGYHQLAIGIFKSLEEFRGWVERGLKPWGRKTIRELVQTLAFFNL